MTVAPGTIYPIKVAQMNVNIYGIYYCISKKAKIQTKQRYVGLLLGGKCIGQLNSRNMQPYSQQVEPPVTRIFFQKLKKNLA